MSEEKLIFETDDDELLLGEGGELINIEPVVEPAKAKPQGSAFFFFVPAVFLLVTLLGGLRFATEDNAFVFLVPPLICLILSAATIVLLVRSRIIRIEAWFSGEYSALQNIAHGGVLASLFCASAQLYNSLLPESGVPMWVIGFLFIWTLWNDLFSDFEPHRLIKSLAAMYAIAFVTKYLVLASLTAPTGGTWLQRIFENPGREAFTWLLDLPHYSAATGYVQFLCVGAFLVGLLLMPPAPPILRDKP